VTVDQPELFTSSPTIDATGQLCFTPAPNVRGTATVTVKAVDDGGTANGGIDASQPQIFNITITKPHPWHNAASRLDVTGRPDGSPDGHVVAEDALAIINYINAFGSGALPAGAAIGQPFGFLDTTGGDNGTGDNFIAPNDALDVINAINAGLGGEGEAGQDAGDRGQESLNELLALLASDVASQAKRRR
jgi:hypothetical protein